MPHNLAGLQAVLHDGQWVPVSVTGTTSEVELGRIVLPPYALGTAGLLRLFAILSATNNANAKTLRLRLGSLVGTQLASSSALASQSLLSCGCSCLVTPTHIRSHPGMANWFATAGSGMVAVANNWATETIIVLSVQLANAGDTVTLEGDLWEGFKF